MLARTHLLLAPLDDLKLVPGSLDDLLVLFELPFEAEVGKDGGPEFPHFGDGLSEANFPKFHDVGDDKGGALGKRRGTLEMPAAQCTRMLPLLMLVSTRL